MFLVANKPTYSFFLSGVPCRWCICFHSRTYRKTSQMYPKRNFSTVKYFVAFTIGVVIYCEWFVYYSRPLHWENLKCSDSKSCTKILFVADPQIQGDLAVPAPINYIFNWDSDRFLKSTFSVIYEYFEPDIIVYMGDLMDEGSISSVKQFHNYVKRLFEIFTVDSDVMQIWIPGDNDIGGENEPIRQDKVQAFEKVFAPTTSIVRIPNRNLTFYKVNGITYSYPKINIHLPDNEYKIVISHYPITVRQMFAKKVNDAVHPNVYFCAHEHQSKYVRQTKELKGRHTVQLQGNEIIEIIDNFLYEIYVPTCSYRMGTSDIGYGAAVLDVNSHLKYTVFWSPGRFLTLFIYLILAIIIFLFILVFFTGKIMLFYKKFSIT